MAFGFPIVATPHFTHLYYCMKGLFHGLIGRLGPLEKNE